MIQKTLTSSTLIWKRSAVSPLEASLLLIPSAPKTLEDTPVIVTTIAEEDSAGAIASSERTPGASTDPLAPTPSSAGGSTTTTTTTPKSQSSTPRGMAASAPSAPSLKTTPRGWIVSPMMEEDEGTKTDSPEMGKKKSPNQNNSPSFPKSETSSGETSTTSSVECTAFNAEIRSNSRPKLRPSKSPGASRKKSAPPSPPPCTPEVIKKSPKDRRAGSQSPKKRNRADLTIPTIPEGKREKDKEKDREREKKEESPQRPFTAREGGKSGRGKPRERALSASAEDLPQSPSHPEIQVDNADLKLSSGGAVDIFDLYLGSIERRSSTVEDVVVTESKSMPTSTIENVKDKDEEREREREKTIEKYVVTIIFLCVSFPGNPRFSSCERILAFALFFFSHLFFFVLTCFRIVPLPREHEIQQRMPWLKNEPESQNIPLQDFTGTSLSCSSKTATCAFFFFPELLPA